ncbi:MAG: DUF2332 domain-containing protein, partial [Chloroflexi bacterium]|nr:DUF2332 domain-containing protein [Chloroflexota bacterium]
MNSQAENQGRIFRRFADVEAREMSPYYAYLAGQVSGDAEILSIASMAGKGQPSPNLLFAAARWLLDRGEHPELLAMYPIDFNSGHRTGSFSTFRQFVLGNRFEIERLVSTHRVQSNVVRRSAVLLLGLMKTAELLHRKPFTSIEIGASAGLTLQWRKYSYRFGDGPEIGDHGSIVHIESRTRGTVPFDGAPSLPDVVDNIGIEIDPVSVNDEEAMSWLRALIWPEHGDNRKLFDSALVIARSDPPKVIAGDALDVLPEILGHLPGGQPANIYHSHTLNQFSVESRDRLDEILARASTERPVTRLGFEGSRSGQSELKVVRYVGGEQRTP